MTRLPESPRRWIEFGGCFVVIAICLTPLPWFITRVATGTLPHNAGLLEVVMSVVGILLLVWLVRLSLKWKRAGVSDVCVSESPATVGSLLEYDLTLGARPEATLICRQYLSRRRSVTPVHLPLAPAKEVDGRWKVRGSIVIPDGPATDPSHHPRTEWYIEVRMRFENGAILGEIHPIIVRR
jgi:hypothetical protein